jgi:hypothetical protein
VKSCNIVRAAVPSDRRVVAPTLNANCGLDFFTIHERPDTRVSGS